MSIRFVQISQPTEYLLKVSEEVKKTKIETEWLSEEEALKLTEKDTCIYIFDTFEGPAFEHIEKLGCRIVGPQCLLSCLSLKIAVPKSKHPVFSLCMVNVVVSCSSIEKTTRDTIHKHVNWMGGKVLKDFSQDVTHLVAGEVGSKKYHVAASLNKHIMLPEWVAAVWEAGKHSHIVATDPQFDCHKCPIFKGCIICVTGLESKQRMDVKRLTDENGGTYTGQLAFNQCTHLIVNTPRGKKYEFAKRWKIHCITMKWFNDSLEKGACQDENLYIAEPDPNEDKTSTSTPVKFPKTEISSLGAADVSSISYIDQSRIDETINSTMDMSSAVGEVNDTLTHLDLYKPPEEDFLDACKIYLSGFSGSRLEKVRKIINIGGATRFSQFTENVSHVVVETGTEDHIELVTSSDFKPVVVNVEWLVECFKQASMVSEQPYICLDVPNTYAFSPQKLIYNVQDKKDTAQKNPPKKVVKESEDEHDEDEVLHYNTTNKQDLSISNETQNKMENEEEEDDDATQITQIQQDLEDANDDTEELTGIFAGKKFSIIEFTEEQDDEIESIISEEGGIVIATVDNTEADYQIVPITGSTWITTLHNVATNCWLQKCIEDQEVYNVSSNPLFKPITLDLDKKPLKDCVVSISQFNGVERDCILHIAELVGAKCQDSFVNKPKKHSNTTKNTHLILQNPEGSKYDAAKRWKIPAVSKWWLLMCAEQSRHVEEDMFLIDNQEHEATLKSISSDDPQPQPPATTTENVSWQEEEQNNKTVDNDPQPQPPTTTTENVSRLEKQQHNKTVDNDPQPQPLATTENVSGHEEQQHNKTVDNNTNEENMEEDVEEENDNKEPVITLTTENELEKVNQTREISEDPQPPPPETTENEFEKVNQPREILRSENSVIELIPENVSSINVEFPKPMLVNRRLSELQMNNSASVNDTPSKFLADGYRPKFDFTDALKFLETPPDQKKKKKARKSSVSFDDFVKRELQKAVENSDYKRTDESIGFEEESQNSQAFLRGVVLCVSMKLSKKLTEYNKIATELGADFRWTYDAECTHFIYQGKAKDSSKEFKQARQQDKCIVSPHWLLACQEECSYVDPSLYPHTYNPKMSLTVSKTPARSTRKSSRRTKQTSESPGVINKKSRVPVVKAVEESVPSTSKMEPSPTVQETSTIKDTITEEELKMVEAMEKEGGEKCQPIVEQQEDNKVEEEVNEEGELEKEGSLEEREDFQKQMEQLMTSAMSSKGGKRRSRRINSNNSTSNNTSSGGISEDKLNNSGSTRRPRSKMSSITEDTETKAQKGHLSEIPIEASQNIQITWDDPAGREVRKEIMEQLQRSSSPTNQQQSSHDNEGSKNESNNTTVKELMEAQEMLTNEMDDEDRMMEEEALKAPPIRLPPAKPAVAPAPLSEKEKIEIEQERCPPVFMLSSMKQDEKADYAALIEQLGGIVKEATYFDTSTTHLVVGIPSRNEKYLSALSAGKWIVHKSYLEACREAKHFVEEDIHEWGSDMSLKNLPEKIKKLALPASRWRKKLYEEREKGEPSIGAFNGWKVLLCVNQSKEDSFKRLLQTGGAKIISSRPPFNDHHYENTTHAFITSDTASQIDIQTLLTYGILCLKPEYIAEFLMQDPVPDPMSYLYRGAIEILKRSGDQSTLDQRKRKTSSVNTDLPSKKTRLR